MFPRPDAPAPDAATELTAATIGGVLRHSLGLSAWKQVRAPSGQGARWSLRVNPSSGNLHPTEAYVLCGPAPGLVDIPAVYHYAPDRHALELRCTFDARAWREATAGEPLWLVALTSIHWREAWKYGERAFRYCQHDLGHAIAAVRMAGWLYGRGATLDPAWPHQDLAALTGTDRDEDYVDAEREEPACVLIVGHQSSLAGRESLVNRKALVGAVASGRWTGHASRLSDEHVQWTFIDDVARITRQEAQDMRTSRAPRADRAHAPYAKDVVLRRRSALAFDGRSSTPRETFLSILEQTLPSSSPPWDALWWDARVHLVLFVHRVDDLDPGLYVLVRNPRALDALRTAFGREFAWTGVDGRLPLYLLARGDCRRLAQRLSCDQEIAADGFFSLGMIAEFEGSLAEFGPPFYRNLFWESGAVGQVLYLAAESAGARGTGIGCFYDDPVHDVLGVAGHAFQSLYHFAMGMPVEDRRLTTDPGYGWER